MAIFGQTFLGYDPLQGLDVNPICPRRNECATVVWFEKWAFTGWSKGDVSDTGIIYAKGWNAFDMLGNQITGACLGVMAGCGFQGNETCKPPAQCKDDDAWLAFARQRCNADALPPPGAVMFVPGFGNYVGR